MAAPLFRFLILGLATLCITSILSNMNTYNFTKICKDPGNENGTKMSARFTKFEQSALQSSVAVGALGASVPYTLLFQRYSTRVVFLSAGIISIVSTALVPLANHLGFGFFLAARICQGVGFSASFPVIGAVTADWAALGEHGLFLAFLTGCTQLANIFTMPVAGALCTSVWGWPSVYYVHAGLVSVLFAIWIVVFRDTPQQHGLVGKRELMVIANGKPEKKTERSRVPYGSVLRSKSIWVIWIAAFADLICVQLVSMYDPVYMNDFLDFSVMNTGIMAALPIVVQFCFKVVAGVSSDAITFLSETTKVRVFNSVALAASAVFFIILAFIPRDKATLSMIILTATISLLGFNTAGFNKAATLHSRQHSHFVMTQVMNIWALTILIEPFIVDAVLTDYTSVTQWRGVFLGHAVLLLLCNGFFILWADARPALWTLEKPTGPNSICEDDGNTKL